MPKYGISEVITACTLHYIRVIIVLGGDCMKRVNLYITDEQEKWLKEQVEKSGLSGVSEIVRRILDKEMKKE